MISIVIPAYNEEKRILRTLKEYYSFFEKEKTGFEIIVVANNCSDRTPEIVGKFCEKKPKCTLYDIPQKTGKFGAIKTGFSRASGDWLCFVDADNSTPPAEFRKVLDAAKENNCVAIASRSMPGSRVMGQPSYRGFLGQGFNFVVNLLFGMGINDTQCGAKVFPAKVARKLLGMQASTGWEFDVEMLWHCRKENIMVIEVPITWTEYGESKFSLAAIPNMAWGVLKVRLREP